MAGAPAVERFVAAATKLGIQPEVKTFPKDTRTAQQAAEALGCDLGQIVKSLIFKAGDELVLVLTSGVNRVDETKTATVFGVDKLGQSQPRRGQSSPLGLPSAESLRVAIHTLLRSVIDNDLLTWQTVWAAAGAPDAVFEVAPERLVEITGATSAEVS